MARTITLKQAMKEMDEQRADYQRFLACDEYPYLCIDCNDETPIGCPCCCLKDVEILMHGEVPDTPPLLREDAFPPAADEPARCERACSEPKRCEPKPKPRAEFLEPEPVSPGAKRSTRAADLARWRKANGWTGPFVRFAGEDADCYDVE